MAPPYRGYVAETEPELILNCAAYTAVDGCETNQETAYRINGEGPRLLAEAAVERGCRLIHISTDYVFDGMRPVPQPYLEHDPVNPLSVYGKSKLMGEQGVAETAPDSLILRTAWLYSAHGANFLKTMLRLALSDPKRNFTIVDDQYGSLTWSHTLARQIERILDTDLTGIVHTTSQGYSTWYEAACYFLGQMEVPHRLRALYHPGLPYPGPQTGQLNSPERGIGEGELLGLRALAGRCRPHCRRPWL